METLYSVMIVEKQEQMVHIIKNMLPWNDYGFQISSTTDNEDKALAYYGEYLYDLVFTAIDLKEGNGLSLIRQIKHLNDHSHVVVISAHEDYDTVRDAFKAGADDYLLKSRLRYSLLAFILEEIKKKLDADTDIDHDNIKWQDQLEKLLGLIRDKQKVDRASIDQILQRKELSLLRGSYQILYFRMDNVRIFNRNMKQYDKPSWMSADEFINMFQNKLVLRDEMQLKLKEIIQDLFQDVSSYHLIFTKKHSGLIVVPPLAHPFLKEKANQLIAQIKEILTYEFGVTMSAMVKGVDGFLPMYEALLRYHEHKFYDGDCCVEDMMEQKQFTMLKRGELIYDDKIVHALNVQMMEHVLPLCAQAVTYMKEHLIEPGQVKDYFCIMIDKIEAMIKEKNFTELYPFDVLRQGIRESESIMYLDLELEKILKTLIDWMKENNVSRYKKKVSDIMQYILDHADQKLTLGMIADHMGLSEIHTSRIFKKETGKSLITYVNEVKMNRAAKLLEDEHLKIKDIAHMVGMDDQLYFNKVFHRFYQMSPREYRKKQ